MLEVAPLRLGERRDWVWQEIPKNNNEPNNMMSTRINDGTITKCDNDQCTWQGPYKAQVLQRREDGFGHDHVCPKCGHDTFTLPLEKPDAVIVLQLEPGEAWMSHEYAERASLIVDAEGRIVKNLFGPVDLPWQVWEVNDLPETVLARTREEAVMGIMQHYGHWRAPAMDVKAECENWENGLYEDLADVAVLDDETLERRKFIDEGPDGEEVTRTFREELAERLAKGARCELFSTSEM